jgi:hypothetical protein
MRHGGRAAGAAAVAAASLLVVGTAGAVAPVEGSISGPVTTAKGKTFVVKTTLSPTGSSKVTVTAKTTIHEQVAGRPADLKKGVCVTAIGTKKGKVVAATRVSLAPAVGGSCTGGFGGRGTRPPGSRPPGGGSPPTGGSGGGFTRPANFGFASGRVTAVKGRTLTVKGRTGTTKVTVSAKAQVQKTQSVKMAAVTTKLCAFVRGTSTDKGVTVTAQDVALSKPVGGSCTFRRRGAGP